MSKRKRDSPRHPQEAISPSRDCTYSDVGIVSQKRTNVKTMKQDAIREIQKKYPKYDKYLHSKVLKGELYGIQIRTGARQLLGIKNSEDSRKLKRSARCRLTEEEYALLLEAVRISRYDTVQDFLRYIVNDYAHAVCKGAKQ